jgi:hypothetical protein
MAVALDRAHAEAKRAALILALFLLLSVSGAWPKNGLTSPDLPQNLRYTVFRTTQEQQQNLCSAQSSVPDAPSAVSVTQQRKRSPAFVNAKSPLVFGGAAINVSMARESQAHLAPGATPALALYIARQWFKRKR